MDPALLKIGCCGFPLPKIKYAEQFCVGEVQQTFYEPPRITTLERWRASVPPEFEFTLKAWQLITHTSRSPTFRRLKTKLTPEELAQAGSFQATSIVQQAWEKSRACAKALAAKYILFQCPASFTPTAINIDNLQRFFLKLDRDDLKLLWEPRGEWPAELIRSLCEELKLIHTVDPFVSTTTSTELIYFRLHGGKGFKHVYTDAELQTVIDLIPPKTPAYVMFNNIAMFDDAQRFQKIAALQFAKNLQSSLRSAI